MSVRLLMVLAAVVPSIACDRVPLPICNALELSPVIFIGEVIDGGITSIRQDPVSADPKHVRFSVLENFRGIPAGTQTVDVQLIPLEGVSGPVGGLSPTTSAKPIL